MKAQRGVEVQLHSFFNLGTAWCGWSMPHPGHFTSGIGTRYLLCISVLLKGSAVSKYRVVRDVPLYMVSSQKMEISLHRLYEYLRSPIALNNAKNCPKFM